MGLFYGFQTVYGTAAYDIKRQVAGQNASHVWDAFKYESADYETSANLFSE
jgi:hypothetical protein